MIKYYEKEELEEGFFDWLNIFEAFKNYKQRFKRAELLNKSLERRAILDCYSFVEEGGYDEYVITDGKHHTISTHKKDKLKKFEDKGNYCVLYFAEYVLKLVFDCKKVNDYKNLDIKIV